MGLISVQVFCKWQRRCRHYTAVYHGSQQVIQVGILDLALIIPQARKLRRGKEGMDWTIDNVTLMPSHLPSRLLSFTHICLTLTSSLVTSRSTLTSPRSLLVTQVIILQRRQALANATSQLYIFYKISKIFWTYAQFLDLNTIQNGAFTIIELQSDG